jgi:hypothetical protein
MPELEKELVAMTKYIEKVEQVVDRYPDLSPGEVARAVDIKRAFLVQRGVDGSRTETPPQDYAVEIVRAEKARGITLSDDRTIALMYVLGNRLEGSEPSETALDTIFKEQVRENAKIASKVAKVSDAVAKQAESASEVDKQV